MGLSLACLLLAVAAVPAAVGQPLGVARITLQGRQNCPQRGELNQTSKCRIRALSFVPCLRCLHQLLMARHHCLVKAWLPRGSAGLLTAQACG